MNSPGKGCLSPRNRSFPKTFQPNQTKDLVNQVQSKEVFSKDISGRYQPHCLSTVFPLTPWDAGVIVS